MSPGSGQATAAAPAADTAELPSVRQPLDLRLLPAACAAWLAALLVLPASAGDALRLGVVALSTALTMVLALCLLARTVTSRWWGVSLHVVLALAVVGAVCLSAGAVHHRMDTTGWQDAVKDGVPVEATLRITEDSQPVGGPGTEDATQLRVRAVVLSAALPHAGGAPRSVRNVRADVVLITDAPTPGESAPVVAGQRYSGWITTSETTPGDRATALVKPLSAQGLVEEPPDTWAQLSSAFNHMRSTAVDAASFAVGEGPALLPGVVLGDRSQQSQELTDAMNIAGLSHMSVVSGTHCALVMGALLGLVRILRAPRWAALICAVLGLVLYVMLVQPAPSVIRAAVMGAIGALAVFAGRGKASSALLCLCVVILLIYSPWFAVEPAFQLSVVATAGIVLIGARLKDALGQKIPGWVAGPLSLAISAQIFVTPVLLPIADGVTLYSIPANIVAGPLLPLATVPGTFAALVAPVLPWLGIAVMWLAGWAAAGIAVIGYGSAALPQALAPWPGGWLGVLMVLAYCAAAIVVSVVIIRRRRPRMIESAGFAAAAGMMVAVVVPATGLWSGSVSEVWRYALCDVDQGDMVVVRTGERSAVILDTGEDPELAAECLHHLGVEEVDALLLSHEHSDHVSGTPGVAEAAEIHQVKYSGSEHWSAQDELESWDIGHIPAVRAHKGDSAQYLEDYPVRWTVWSASGVHANPNDNSMVVLVELWDAETPAGAVGSANNPLRLLATGDLEEQITSILLRADALPEHVDVLKISHHGAANGGTEILQHAQPSSALIGVGAGNSYGHPHSSIIEELNALDASVYRTDRHGTVVFSLTSTGEIRAESP